MASRPTQPALAALEHEGLVARSGEDTKRFVASPPGVTLGALLVRRQNEIRLAEVELGSLDELYRSGSRPTAAPPTSWTSSRAGRRSGSGSSSCTLRRARR